MCEISDNFYKFAKDYSKTSNHLPEMEITAYCYKTDEMRVKRVNDRSCRKIASILESLVNENGTAIYVHPDTDYKSPKIMRIMKGTLSSAWYVSIRTFEGLDNGIWIETTVSHVAFKDECEALNFNLAIA